MGPYSGLSAAGVTVTVTDDDTAGVTVSESTLGLDEGDNGTYTMVLDTQPASPVVITVTSNNSAVTLDTDTGMSGDQNTLTFTRSNWDTPQTVTVATSRDTNVEDDSATISHDVEAGISADEYDNVSINDVSVTVTDNDGAGVTNSESALTVAEGGSAAYTVRLDTKPSANVKIIINTFNDDVTVDTDTGTPGNQKTVTFTPSNWNTPQTVKVFAAHDADAVNDQVELRYTVSSGDLASLYSGLSAAGVAVTVTDDDTAGVTVSGSMLTVPEGDNNTYTVVLDTQPTSDVVINVTKSGSPDVTVSPLRLTFSSSNWSTAQTVTVAAAHDADGANDDAAKLTHAVVATGSANEYDTVDIAAVAVTVTDDDSVGVTVFRTALTVAEGADGTYTVKLDTLPTSDVVITVTSDNSDVTADTDAGMSGKQNTLTFTPSNWSVAQTVTVTADQDADAADDAAILIHAVVAAGSADEYDNVSIARVRVAVSDDETATPGVRSSVSKLTVAEGGSATFTVVLNTAPPDRLTVSLTEISNSEEWELDHNLEMEGNQRFLTFTPTNWNTPQPVSVASGQDADAVNDIFRVRYFVQAATGSAPYHFLRGHALEVIVVDDDATRVTLTETRLTVLESGNSAYTVVLSTQPTSDVVIDLTKSGSPDVTVSPATLTFTSTNWSTAQTVTVRAAADADAADDRASIAHEVDATRSANEYDNVPVAAVAVTVTDGDTAAVTVSESTLTVAEGAKGTYTVVLDTQPTSDVVIAVTSNSSDVTVSPSRLTFTSSDWSTAQTVTVTAAADDDAVNDAASIAHAVVAASSADEYDTVTVAAVTVTVADDETAGVTVSESTLTVAEGADGAYTVVLDAQPTSDVVITVTAAGSSDVTVDTDTAPGDQNMLTFTSTNWNTAQTVTVAAADDADAANDAASLAHAVVAAGSADEYDAVTVAGVAVTVTDDDTAGVTVSVTTLTVAEGATGAYTVVLDTQPASDVVITVTKSGSSDVTVDTDTGTSDDQNTLTFTSTNWSTAQTVTVSAAYDPDAANDAASLAHAVDASRSADEYDTVTVAGVAVTVTDDDTAGVTVSRTTLLVPEGDNDTYTVVLDTQPASDVVITVTSNNSDVTVDTGTSGNQNTLTFTSINWFKAQTVTVSAAADDDAANDAASIAHAVDASRSVDEYDAVTVAAVAVTVTDDETAAVTVSVTTLRVDEGANGTYTVVLDAQPTSNVVIAVTAAGSSDVTVSPATLTFSSSNWRTAQTVTVTAADDADTANDAASISHAVVAASSADEYDAVTVAAVAVTVADDDTAGVRVSVTTLRVAEGATGAYTVKLNTQPASDVVITVTSNNSDVTVDTNTATTGNQNMLTFTSTNWNTAQTVTVTAAQDNDAANDAATLAHAVVAASSADEYDAVTVAAVAVTVTDDDTAGVTVSVTTLPVAEGANGTYTVKLDTQPASDVVITVTSNNSDVTVDTNTGTGGNQNTLTFTSTNWNTAQTVTVTAADDADAANDAATLAHAVVAASSADEYDTVTVAAVAVTVTDDETAAVTVSVTTLPVAEGANGTYTVKLDTPPTSDVVINVTAAGSSDVTVSPATLTFTPSNWSTAQTVTVRAAADADAADDSGLHLPRGGRLPERRRVRHGDRRGGGGDRHRRRNRRGDGLGVHADSR